MHLRQLHYTDDNLTDLKAAVICFVVTVNENMPSFDRMTHSSVLTLPDEEVLVGI
jgi:hypothetical protein